jgi:hypothetical protein
VVFISSSLFCGSVGCVVHLALFEFPHYPQNGHKGQDFLSAGAVSSINPAILVWHHKLDVPWLSHPFSMAISERCFENSPKLRIVKNQQDLAAPTHEVFSHPKNSKSSFDLAKSG